MAEIRFDPQKGIHINQLAEMMVAHSNVTLDSSVASFNDTDLICDHHDTVRSVILRWERDKLLTRLREYEPEAGL